MPNHIPFWTKAFFDRQGLSCAFSPGVSSSNDWAKAQALQKIEGPSDVAFLPQQQETRLKQDVHAFLTQKQSAGRGQNGKTWANSDLMISFLWEGDLRKITQNTAKHFVFDLLTALQAPWPDLPLSVKAPNDLLLNGKKVAGLLLEPIQQGGQTALIAGLGLNVFSAPKQLTVAYLAKHTNNITDKTWGAFLNHLLTLWNQRAFTKPIDTRPTK